MQPDAHLPIAHRFNQTQSAFTDDKCLHQLFEAQVVVQPHATAVIDSGRSWTYEELNTDANRLAHSLIDRGASGLIGLCVDRSHYAAIGIMGILKAGCAYVPLDPGYPKKRLATLIESTQLSCVVTLESFVHKLPDGTFTALCLDTNITQLQRALTINPNLPVKVTDAVYVIFTSGSTGTPKGVQLNHQGRVNNFYDFNQRFTVGASDCLLSISSLSFDMSAYDIMGILAAGATTLFAPTTCIPDPATWAALMREHKVTVWHSVPALLQLYVDYIEDHTQLYPTDLRLVLLGGDWIPLSLPERIKQVAPGVQVISMGGATECSMDSTIFEIGEVDPAWKSIPYGFPMANQTTYVLDESLQPVACGEIGELFIGGIGVGDGYIGHPKLTAERFLPNPFLDGAKERMYKTGDLVKQQPDGNLELLGRVDFQIKIRGHRIECGEIEAALRLHTAVRDCIVTAVNRFRHASSVGQEKRLVAFIVPGKNYLNELSRTLYQEQIIQWQAVYDHAYSANIEPSDPSFNIVSWDDSFTGAPIPAAAMREWVDATVSCIQSRNPEHVLEIGCGMGLLLFRLAPDCKSYTATDISQVALNYVSQERDRRHWDHVTLRKQSAEDFSGMKDHEYDLIILNSITQNFPSMEFLAELLKNCARLVKPGGHIFVGDNRNFDQATVFSTSIELSKASPNMTREQVDELILKNMRSDPQLQLSPYFFSELQECLPAVSAVNVQLKRGALHNELTRYRYDVWLTIDGTAPTIIHDDQVIDFSEASPSVDDLFEAARHHPRQSLYVTSIPNIRWREDLATRQAFQNLAPTDIVRDITMVDDKDTKRVHLDPEDFFVTAHSSSYDISLFYSPSQFDCFDVFLTNKSAPCSSPNNLLSTRHANQTLANVPLHSKLHKHITPELTAYLEECLPTHMIPEAFVVLEQFPLTANGKINRVALALPDQALTSLVTDYVQATTALESMLADLWMEVLGLDRIGIHDGFIAIGGNSLVATQLYTSIHEHFQAQLPIRLHNLTIHFLAVELRQATKGSATTADEIAASYTRATRTSEREKNATHFSHSRIPASRASQAQATMQQEGLWHLDQLNPGQAIYNVPSACRIEGPLHHQNLERAFNTMLERHDALRTSFHFEQGKLMQKIAVYKPTSLVCHDLSSLSREVRDAQARTMVEADTRQPFDLAQGPLFRWFLIRLKNDLHVLVFTLHHIITDGWSMGVINEEWTQLYAAYSRGETAMLPKLPLQYSDFAAWQRQHMQGETLARCLAFWENELATEIPPLDMGLKDRKSFVSNYSGHHHTFTLPASTSDALRAFSRSEARTLFSTLMAAFAIVLRSYASTECLSIGATWANRSQRELEPIIGYFVNTIPFTIDLSGNPSYTEVSHRTQRKSVAISDHQDLPFIKMVQHFLRKRDPTRNPFFQVAFTYLEPEFTPSLYGYGFNTTGKQTAQCHDLVLAPYPIESGVSKFDLTLLLWDDPGGIQGTIEYATALFSEAFILEFSDAFHAVLNRFISAPNDPIGPF